MASSWIVVVPELADVPVFRAAMVQVPLGVDVVCASFCATHGDPPSSIDMTKSTDEAGAADAAAGTRLKAKAMQTQSAATARFAACVCARLNRFNMGTPPCRL
jgi:hypothetical protein